MTNDLTSVKTTYVIDLGDFFARSHETQPHEEFSAQLSNLFSGAGGAWNFAPQAPFRSLTPAASNRA
jgi:hypothetical protein